MKINKAGLDLIKNFEGLRLLAYKDSVGIWTIGYGHTNGVKERDVITSEQANAFLQQDVQWAEEAVGEYVEVDLTPNQFSALVSFVFNCGASAFKDSTMLKFINKKDFASAAKEFLRWNKAGGQVLEGLTRRREAEMLLFVSKDPKAVSETPPTVPVRKNWLFICPANDPKTAI